MTVIKLCNAGGEIARHELEEDTDEVITDDVITLLQHSWTLSVGDTLTITRED